MCMDANEYQMAKREERAARTFTRGLMTKVAVPMTVGLAALTAALEERPLEHVGAAWDTARPAVVDTLRRTVSDEPRMYPGDHGYFTMMADTYRGGVNQAERPLFEAMQQYLTKNPAFAESLPEDVRDVYLGDR